MRLKQEIRQHAPEAVLKSIEAFEQYRNQTVVEKPVACLISMMQVEAEPNMPQEPTTPEEREFDEWYAQAIQQGFVLDLPKNHLGEICGELQVKVKDSKVPGGYINMGWRKAKELMLN